MKRAIFSLLVATLLVVNAGADAISFSWTPTDTDSLTASRYKADRNTLQNWGNGNITNTNIKATANIAQNKIDSTDGGWISGTVGLFEDSTGYRYLRSEKGWVITLNDSTAYGNALQIVSDSTDTIAYFWPDSIALFKSVRLADSVVCEDSLIVNFGARVVKTMSADSVFSTKGILCTQINTGEGLTEVYAMDQDVQTTDAPTFATVNTGQGAHELYAMNQDVETTDGVTFSSVTTDVVSSDALRVNGSVDGDVIARVHNAQGGGGSTNENSVLEGTLSAGGGQVAVGGKIVIDKRSDYGSQANCDAAMLFYTAKDSTYALGASIDENQNFGIGTNSQTEKLYVTANVDGDVTAQVHNSNGGGGSANETVEFRATFSRGGGQVDPAGRVVFGKEQDYATAANTDAYCAIYTTLDSTESEVARFTSAGDLGLGVTPSYRLHVTDDATGQAAYIFNDGNNINREGLTIQCGADDQSGSTSIYITANDGDGDLQGTIEVASGTFQITDASDERLKDNITDAQPKLDKLMQVPVKNFRFGESGTLQDGMIAQDLEAVFPEMVTEKTYTKDSVTAEGDTVQVEKTQKMIYPLKMIPWLLKGMQEQQVQIDNLNVRVGALESALEGK